MWGCTTETEKHHIIGPKIQPVCLFFFLIPFPSWKSLREYLFALRLLKDWCPAGHSYTFLGFTRQAVPVSAGLSWNCCSEVYAERRLLHSYQSFLAHIMVQFNPLTTLFKMYGVTGESLNVGEGYLAAERGREK